MVPSLPLLSCKSTVSVTEILDRKKKPINLNVTLSPIEPFACNKMTEEWGEIFEELTKERGSF